MTLMTEMALLRTIKRCALRQMGGYGPCYCRDPQPNEHQGHEDRCKNLNRAVRASEAATGASPG